MFDFINYTNKVVDTDKIISKFKPEVFANIDTGEIKYPIKCSDGPLEIIICKEVKTNKTYLKVCGSIHKYYNFVFQESSINYNDFKLNQIKIILEYLSKKYYFYLGDGYISSLEFSFNLETKVSPTKIILDKVLLFKSNECNRLDFYNGNGTLKRFDCYEFYIKFYDKSKKERLPNHILRIELKLRTNKILRRYSMDKLTSLYNKITISKLWTYFISQLNEVTIIDHIDLDLKKKDKQLYKEFTEPIIHRELRKRLSRAGIKKRKKRFNDILIENGLIRTKGIILKKLETKYCQLINS